jgi:hypothetical protein
VKSLSGGRLGARQGPCNARIEISNWHDGQYIVGRIAHPWREWRDPEIGTALRIFTDK